MRAYVVTTGFIFALIVAAHIWRMIAESPSLATDPAYLALTLAAGLLAAWAARLAWRGDAAR
jgi:hypothetical protein